MRPPTLPTTLATALLAACSGAGPEANVEREALGRHRQPVLYDGDSRQEAFESPYPELVRQAQRALVALVPDDSLAPVGGRGDPNALWSLPTLAQQMDLCPDVNFAEQPSGVICTGMLVAPDLVLTAGHCARNLDCDSLNLVFGYYYDASGVPHSATEADWYGCQEIIDYQIPSTLENLDFGWIRLDRAVGSEHAPVVLQQERQALGEGQPLALFGFGSGLPMKAQFDAQVRDARAETLDYFLADLDAFEGSSGAPVFDSAGLVVGVLASGNRDFRQTEEGCWEPEELSGEHAIERVTYVANAVQEFEEWAQMTGPSPKANGESVPLTSGGSGACTIIQASKQSQPFGAVVFLFLGLSLIIRRPFA